MTSATRSVAVVATRLPTIDRRALSQAWFSALHLAQPPGCTVSPHAAAPAPSGSSAPRPVVSAQTHAPAGPLVTRPHVPGRAAAPGTVLPERRGPTGDLARRIERAIIRHGAVRAPHTAAIAINAGDGRVQILVRSDGTTTRIIALCAPHLRERVDRALAHARFALAASGTRLEVAP